MEAVEVTAQQEREIKAWSDEQRNDHKKYIQCEEKRSSNQASQLRKTVACFSGEDKCDRTNERKVINSFGDTMVKEKRNDAKDPNVHR